jgi:hypothetical protein
MNLVHLMGVYLTGVHLTPSILTLTTMFGEIDLYLAYPERCYK